MTLNQQLLSLKELSTPLVEHLDIVQLINESSLCVSQETVSLEELNPEIFFSLRDDHISVSNVAEQFDLEKINCKHIVDLLDIYKKINIQTIKNWLDNEFKDSLTTISLETSSVISNKANLSSEPDSVLRLRGGAGQSPPFQKLPLTANVSSSHSNLQAALRSPGCISRREAQKTALSRRAAQKISLRQDQKASTTTRFFLSQGAALLYPQQYARQLTVAQGSNSNTSDLATKNLEDRYANKVKIQNGKTCLSEEEKKKKIDQLLLAENFCKDQINSGAFFEIRDFVKRRFKEQKEMTSVQRHIIITKLFNLEPTHSRPLLNSLQKNSSAYIFNDIKDLQSCNITDRKGNSTRAGVAGPYEVITPTRENLLEADHKFNILERLIFCSYDVNSSETGNAVLHTKAINLKMFDFELNPRIKSLVEEPEISDINLSRCIRRLLSDELIFELLQTYDIPTIKYLLDVDISVLFYEFREITNWIERIGLENIEYVSGACFEYTVFCHNFRVQINLLLRNIQTKSEANKPISEQSIILILENLNASVLSLYKMYLYLYKLGEEEFEYNSSEEKIVFNKKNENFMKFKNFIKVEFEKVSYSFKKLDSCIHWFPNNKEIKQLVKTL